MPDSHQVFPMFVLFMVVCGVGFRMGWCWRSDYTACKNCDDYGRVTSYVAGRAGPLNNYCPKLCKASQREFRRDQLRAKAVQ